MVFTRKQNMEITKSEKFLKKRNKTFWGIFFLYDVIQEREWIRAFLTLIFKKDDFY